MLIMQPSHLNTGPFANRTTFNHLNTGLVRYSDDYFIFHFVQQNTFSKLTSSDKLQGSIERLAEKWEAKRKNLSEDSSEDFDMGGFENRPQRSSPSTSLSEQSKLVAIKQQGIPKRRSLLKPPTGPR